MKGAIVGDIIGSRHERGGKKTTKFILFHKHCKITDDSVMTIAVADALLHDKPYAETLREWGLKYPRAGYGGNFRKWLVGEIQGPYHSYGNGSAMRVSPAGYLDSMEKVLAEAEKSAAVSHNHPEGIKGAQAVAAAIFLAREGRSKEYIKVHVESEFGYDLSRTPDEIRPSYTFDVSCQGSVPESIICFLASENVEDAIRLAISLGGDADTQAAIAGSIAEAFYGGLSPDLVQGLNEYLPDDMKAIVKKFKAAFP